MGTEDRPRQIKKLEDENASLRKENIRLKEGNDALERDNIELQKRLKRATSINQAAIEGAMALSDGGY